MFKPKEPFWKAYLSSYNVLGRFHKQIVEMRYVKSGGGYDKRL